MRKSYRYEVILVGVDFSAPSRQALGRAVDLARRFEARLEVVHVVEKLKPAIPFSPRNRAAVQRLQKDLMDTARERLRAFVPASARLSTRTRVLTGVPDVAFLNHAERCGADLLVLANRGHSPLEELLLGSTAERVLRTTLLPVMLVSVPGAAPARG